MPKVVIDPVTRIEGHLKIEVDVDRGKVIDARSSGTLYRGFETILKGRDPRDSQHLTQRICGVCSIGHAITSARCLDDALGAKVPPNGRIVRNLIQGANFIMSHIFHFYHLAALDYITGPDTAPSVPRVNRDYRLSSGINNRVVRNYVEAFTIRRKAQEMLAVFGGKVPHITTIIPGGVTEKVTQEKVDHFRTILHELSSFVESVYIPDVFSIAEVYKDYWDIGRGCKNALAFGVFPLEDGGGSEGQNLFIKSGVYTNGQFGSLDLEKISEAVKYSRYKDETAEPQPNKLGAYSWIRAPRYEGLPHEAGPLPRMWVNKVAEVFDLGEKAFSVMGRHVARAVECKLVAKAMFDWLNLLKPGEPTHLPCSVPEEGSGMGLWEGPRGCIGHFVEVKDYKIQSYKITASTVWNASPRDDKDEPGPIEKALVGTPVDDLENPIEVARVVRSFDPCMGCSVHLLEMKDSWGRVTSVNI
ncbi:MAG: nickel-dependent hydrogenase large subunit [Bacillota bacterium]